MIKLDAKNYYDKGTKALSNSRIKDYLTCPRYFYNKHIACTIEDDPKEAFVFGGIVDKLLSGEDFDKNYEVCEGIRTKKLKEDAESRGVTLLTPLQYQEIFEVADAVEKTDAFKYIKERATFQDILQIPYEINEHFDSLTGRPDFWWIDGDGTCFIVDLKTSAVVDHRKYYYQALGFKYQQQLAMYEMLISSLNNVKSFRSFNLVVSKQKNIYGVELFEYPRELINDAKLSLLETIDKIAQDKSFAKYNPSFNNPIILGSFSNDEVGTGDWSDGEDKEE